METKNKQQSCNGQCAMCQFQQRVYCAAYLARNNYAMMGAMLEKIDTMQNAIVDLHTRINAIQSVEGDLVKPFAEKDDVSFENDSTSGVSGADE